MLGLGEFSGFILASYALVILVIGALIIWVANDLKRQKRLIKELEERGIRRRSQQPKAD